MRKGQRKSQSAPPSLIRTSRNFVGGLVYAAGSVQQLEADMSTLEWKDFKKKYRIPQKRQNFEASMRRAYNTLEKSPSTLDVTRAADIRRAYENRKGVGGAKKKKQSAYPKAPPQAPPKRKYPTKWKDRRGNNECVNYLTESKSAIRGFSYREYEYSCDYMRQDSATMIIDNSQTALGYMDADLLGALSTRFTIQLHTVLFVSTYSEQRRQYSTKKEVQHEIMVKLFDLIASCVSVDFIGCEIYVEAID